MTESYPKMCSEDGSRPHRAKAGLDNGLDREISLSLLKHGVFLSSKVPPVTRPEALILLAEAKLDRFVKEWKGLVRALLSGCELRDFQATPGEISRWFEEEPGSMNEERRAAEAEGRRRAGGIASYSSICKEANETMQFDTQSKLDEYMRLLDQIKQKTSDERTAVALLQEVSKDRRAAEMRQERETNNNDSQDSQPATEKQKQFMKKLGIVFPATVTKQKASMLLDEELGRGGE
jgi:hypothetical protein